MTPQKVRDYYNKFLIQGNIKNNSYFPVNKLSNSALRYLENLLMRYDFVGKPIKFFRDRLKDVYDDEVFDNHFSISVLRSIIKKELNYIFK